MKIGIIASGYYTNPIPVYTDGYRLGGNTPPSTASIDKFPFASPFTTATDAGDLTVAIRYNSTAASTTDGFSVGGDDPTTGFEVTNVDKFPFSTPFTTATSVGDIAQKVFLQGGASSSTEGYSIAGYDFDSTPNVIVDIQRFPFSSPFTTSTNVGDVVTALYNFASMSSTSDGYAAGGISAPGLPNISDTIQSFPFSSPFTATTDIGNLSAATNTNTGMQSATDGYSSGGQTVPGTVVTTVDSFPFSSPFTTASAAGDLASSNRDGGGSSSNDDGYQLGGRALPSTSINVIQSFPFSSPFTTTTDVGDLTAAYKEFDGTQGT